MLRHLSLCSVLLLGFACAAGSASSAADGDDSGRAGLDFGQVEVDPDADCDSVLEVTYRDFDVSHPDFEMVFKGDVVRRGLVAEYLGADSKPVFADPTGCPGLREDPLACDNWEVTTPEIESQESFNQWYRDVPDVNHRFDRTLTLTDQGNGKYVYSSDAFFPIGQGEGWGATPPAHINQNFLFTTELHLAFTYVAGHVFSFYGDDDMWIFVNGRLALDLGGMHGKEAGTIDFDAQAERLGIRPGNVYRMDIFHAERHTDQSNFQIETTIGCFVPVDVEVL